MGVTTDMDARDYMRFVDNGHMRMSSGELMTYLPTLPTGCAVEGWHRPVVMQRPTVAPDVVHIVSGLEAKDDAIRARAHL